MIEPADYEAERNRLKAEIEAMTDLEGNPLGNVVMKPEEIYSATNGIAPDLLVYFGDLSYRCIGKVGNADYIVIEDEVGPDDANHAPDGIFIMAGPGVNGQGRELSGLSIYDVGPTLLRLFDLSVPADMRGRVIDG